ncbi:hypothetical protein [Manganibacter manganicus]|uniref:hypothetical protein n=1 Tax=Manganibacter manganicus TaxID=1873176 RepID=UPI001FD9424B|nr:hypothetical protein [Pseudaminobacter manganicus]
MINDLETATEVLQEISEATSFVAFDGPDRAEELRDALERIEERASWLGQPFERRKVSERLRQGEHLILMHQEM